MNTPSDLTRDHQRRLDNQRAFPSYFVKCACESGCAVCAFTGLVSKAEARQRDRDPIRALPE